MLEYFGELLGTFILILLGNGVVANVNLNKTYSHGGGWIVITAGWAMGVFVGVFAVKDMSGAHLNPAVTLGLAFSGLFPWVKVIPRPPILTSAGSRQRPHLFQRGHVLVSASFLRKASITGSAYSCISGGITSNRYSSSSSAASISARWTSSGRARAMSCRVR